MNDYSYGLVQALRAGVNGGLIGAVLLSIVIYLSPPEWSSFATNVVGVFVIVFFSVFSARSSSSDMLFELGLNYPDLKREASIHQRLDEVLQTLDELKQHVRVSGR